MSKQITEPKTEYLEARLSALRIDEKENTFTRVWSQAVDEVAPGGKIVTRNTEQERYYKIFDADADGNICIHYFNLNGQPYRWKGDDRKMSIDFVRKRLREPKGDFKYLQDKGSPQFPFFPPRIIHKYQLALNAKESGNDQDHAGQIATLFLTEGEFKAFAGSEKADIDIIGLPSIHGFYNGDIKNKLHEDIQELIITCKVQKIVFLVDADLLSLTWADGKDLNKRPSSFYGAIKAFRESLQLLLDDDTVSLQLVYFMHLKSKFMNDAKGLDDLLSKYADRTVEIVEDLHCLAFAKKYFDGYPLTDLNKDVAGRLFKYLGLTDEQEFYKTYGEFIGDREWRWKRRRYIYNEEKKEVVFLKHEDADKFLRIGPDWIKIITTANKYGDLEEEIVPWKISEITRDYAKKYPDFLEHVQKYDGFCNEPCFIESQYLRIQNNNFNLCNPITWQIGEGSIKSSIAFLKHIFQGSGTVTLDSDGKPLKEELTIGDPFAIALDYLSVLLQHPKQMLPVPILVSKENGTGKSTFLKWLQTMFGSNMTILGNDQFKMKFNGHYVTKFIIAIDEGFLEVDKKSEKERLKQLVTADTAFLEHKGMNVRKINYYGKLIICSNDADRVMKIDEGESRWFVVKVPVVPEDLKDPDLELKLKNEVPAWLHFLTTRQIFHPRKDRLWFKPEWFMTEQFKLIVSETKNRIDRLLEDWLKEQFSLFEDHDTLEFDLKYLTEEMNDAKVSKYKIDRLDIKAFLKSKGMEAAKVRWFKWPVGFDYTGVAAEKTGILLDPNAVNPPAKLTQWKGKNGRPYTFKRSEWVIDKNTSLGQDQKTLGSDDLPF